MTTKDLEKLLTEQIPVTKSLGVTLELVSETEVRLAAPLEINRNHMGTAFGGSLSTLMILSGYSWLYHFMFTKGHTGHVILRETQAKFIHPVDENMLIFCRKPSEKNLSTFLATFEKKGLARITLESEIRTSKGKVCSMTGIFVAQKGTENKLC